MLKNTSAPEVKLSGPTGLRTGRAPAPDLARGFMLLLIALANTPFYLFGRAHSEAGMHPVDGTIIDKVVQAFMITTVDLRVYTMFAFLFGYGLMMMYRRQRERGVAERDGFRLLQRRNAWLLVFGGVHALLLWGGDVLGAYGLCGLLVVWLFVRRTPRVMLIWAAVGTGLVVLFAALVFLGGWALLSSPEPMEIQGGLPEFIYESASNPSLLVALLARAMMWTGQTLALQGPLGVVVPAVILLGMWASQLQVLERPERNRPLLTGTAIVGVLIGWLGGLPHALAHVGVLQGFESNMWMFSGVQLATGLACGVGYVAAFGLIGGWIARRGHGVVSDALSAVGKRSLSCYLAQSVLCAPILAAWGFGLGEHLGSATMALYAIAAWLITVLGAVWLERRGRQGPAEFLLRKLTYRQPTS